MRSFSSVTAFSGFPARISAQQLALVAIVIIALVARIYLIDVPTVWLDEAYSLVLARETPARIWALTALDFHPPLYYVLLHYWGIVWGESALAARGLSVLADLGTLLLCLKLMSLIATRRAMWIAALLLALLPVSVRYSQEARMYTLLGFWLMGATVALVCWAKSPRQTRYGVIYGLLMTAAFYTHYFAGLCVLVHWLFWGQTRVDRQGATISVTQWLGVNCAIVYGFLPWLPHFIEQLGGREHLSWIDPVTLQGAMALVWQFTVMGGDSSHPSLWQMVPFFILLLCVATIIVKKPLERPFSVLLVGYFFVPFVALYLVALFVPLFVPRYLVFTAPALAMIVALALDRVWERKSPLLFVLLAVQLSGLVSVYRQTDGLNGTEKRANSDLRHLVLMLNAKALPADEIILSDAFWYPPFAYYSTSGIEPTFEVRSSMSDYLNLFRRGALSLVGDDAAHRYIDANTPWDCQNQRVWWITDNKPRAAQPLFVKGRTPSMTLHYRDFSAYLYTRDSMPDSPASSIESTVKPPRLPAAQSCPPAPSATSANRTRHSPPR